MASLYRAFLKSKYATGLPNNTAYNSVRRVIRHEIERGAAADATSPGTLAILEVLQQNKAEDRSLLRNMVELQDEFCFSPRSRKRHPIRPKELRSFEGAYNDVDNLVTALQHHTGVRIPLLTPPYTSALRESNADLLHKHHQFPARDAAATEGDRENRDQAKAWSSNSS